MPITKPADEVFACCLRGSKGIGAGDFQLFNEEQTGGKACFTRQHGGDTL